MPYTLISLKEAAQFLHLDVGDVRTLATHGELPCEMQGDMLCFRQGELKMWASQKILGLRGKHLQSYHSAGILHHHDLSSANRIVTELVRIEGVEAELMARTRTAAVRAMVDVAERTGLLYDPADLLAELLEREELCSTGIDGGIALLHPRYHDPYMVEDSFICVGRAPTPIPFGAPDGQRTNLFFLVCCQDDKTHLHVLSRICLLCHATDLAKDLRQSDSPEEMQAAIAKAEKCLLG